jgi:hypothetical protein
LHSVASEQRATVDYVTPLGVIGWQLQFEDAIISSHSFSDVTKGPTVETFTLAFTKFSQFFGP